jgi:hypothetical protein
MQLQLLPGYINDTKHDKGMGGSAHAVPLSTKSRNQCMWKTASFSLVDLLS